MHVCQGVKQLIVVNCVEGIREVDKHSMSIHLGIAVECFMPALNSVDQSSDSCYCGHDTMLGKTSFTIP